MNILLTGASGLVGSQVGKILSARNDQTISVTRDPAPGNQSVSWNPLDMRPSKELLAAIAKSNAVIHLAGENIASGRWNEKRKTEIRNSRIFSTTQLAAAINASQTKPQVFLCASAVGFYGNRDDEELNESSPPGTGWLSQVCRDWEAAAAGAQCRVVHLRFGVILSECGGALPKIIRPFRIGLGGPIGKGNQWMSWVTLDDAARAILYLMEKPQTSGPVNIVAPEPITNNDFSRAAAKVLHRPALLRAPATVLRLVLGEMADELLLSSQRALPGILEKTGFEFQYPTLEPALRRLVHRPR